MFIRRKLSLVDGSRVHASARKAARATGLFSFRRREQTDENSSLLRCAFSDQSYIGTVEQTLSLRSEGREDGNLVYLVPQADPAVDSSAVRLRNRSVLPLSLLPFSPPRCRLNGGVRILIDWQRARLRQK